MPTYVSIGVQDVSRTLDVLEQHRTAHLDVHEKLAGCQALAESIFQRECIQWKKCAHQ